MSLDVSWGEYISRVSSLKKIAWAVPPDGLYNSREPINPFDLNFRQKRDLMRAKFFSAFGHLEQIPDITIRAYDYLGSTGMLS